MRQGAPDECRRQCSCFSGHRPKYLARSTDRSRHYQRVVCSGKTGAEWKEHCTVAPRVPLSGRETRHASGGSQQPVKEVGEKFKAPFPAYRAQVPSRFVKWLCTQVRGGVRTTVARRLRERNMHVCLARTCIHLRLVRS